MKVNVDEAVAGSFRQLPYGIERGLDTTEVVMSLGLPQLIIENDSFEVIQLPALANVSSHPYNG